MRIAFVWSVGGPKNWNDTNLEGGIGGSEAMMILYARQLASLGHEVHCYSPSQYGATYHAVQWHQWAWWSQRPELDVVISLRTPQPLYDVPDCPVRVFWANDQKCDALPEAVEQGIVNCIMFISHYQSSRYMRLYPQIPTRLFLVSSAGVDFSAYEASPQKVELLCIHCSSPERGLEHLIRLWPRILAKVPNAYLRVTGGFELYGASREEARKGAGALYEKLRPLPNAQYVGIVCRHNLRDLMQMAAVMLYPSIYDEMCCIAALEAQAAQCPLVTTNRGALSERVDQGKSGYLISGMPGERNYDDEFVTRTIELLLDPELRKRMGKAARVKAVAHAYPMQARLWINRFKLMVE